MALELKQEQQAPKKVEILEIVQVYKYVRFCKHVSCFLYLSCCLADCPVKCQMAKIATVLGKQNTTQTSKQNLKPKQTKKCSAPRKYILDKNACDVCAVLG